MCFTKHTILQYKNNISWVTGFLLCWISSPKIDPKNISTNAKTWIKKLTDFWTCFSDLWSRFESILGAMLGLKQYRERQDGHNKDIKGLKVPKNNTL